MAKTEKEIEDLKSSWKHDPIWDLEHTEGFEEHFEELKKFSDQCYENWERRDIEAKKADMLYMGLDFENEQNKALYEYIKKLEWSVQRLESRVETLESDVY